MQGPLVAAPLALANRRVSAKQGPLDKRTLPQPAGAHSLCGDTALSRTVSPQHPCWARKASLSGMLIAGAFWLANEVAAHPGRGGTEEESDPAGPLPRLEDSQQEVAFKSSPTAEAWHSESLEQTAWHGGVRGQQQGLPPRRQRSVNGSQSQP